MLITTWGDSEWETWSRRAWTPDPQKLCVHKSVLSSVPKIVVTCYCSHGKLSQAFKGITSAKIPTLSMYLGGNSESDFVQ